MTVIRVSLPWPPAALNDNASRRGNIWPKIKATKRYRYEAKVLGLMAKLPCCPTARLVFTYHPPRRGGDVQNVHGRLKAAIDGLAEAMGCDDKLFRCAFPEVFADPVKGGAVIVDVEIL